METKKIKQKYKNLKKQKKMGERPLFSIIQSYKVGEKNCQPQDQMQHIEIPVHPNHTIDNNYACTHIEKNTHCQLYACWEKND